MILDNKAEFTMSCPLNAEMLQALVGVIEPSKVFVECDVGTYIPIRRHKKKRIQKKWIKRYGYKRITERRSFDGCEIQKKINGDITEYEFTKRFE